MLVPQTFKTLLQRSASCFGYRIEKLSAGDSRAAVESPIDVLDLVITPLAEQRGADFFFIQIGANDGTTDDPIRRYINRYHWRGILLEPLPDVFQTLVRNYAGEDQLIFENAAIADHDGTATFFVASAAPGGAADDPSATNLSVFSSLRRDAVERALQWRELHQAADDVRSIEVRARSVRSLIEQHHITRLDLLQSDVQGYDCDVVQQFLDCGLRPQIIHFEHIHTRPDELHECYQRLAHDGYQFIELANDTVATLKPPSGLSH